MAKAHMLNLKPKTNVFIDVAEKKEDTEFNIKLNRLHVIAFCQLECGTYKLYTAGGWVFYAKAIENKPEEPKVEEATNLEIG